MTDFCFYVHDVTCFSPFILPFRLYLAAMSDCKFLVISPPEFTQLGLHLLGCSFAPILADPFFNRCVDGLAGLSNGRADPL